MEMYRPQMTMAGISLTSSVDAINACGNCESFPIETPFTR